MDILGSFIRDVLNFWFVDRRGSYKTTAKSEQRSAVDTSRSRRWEFWLVKAHFCKIIYFSVYQLIIIIIIYLMYQNHRSRYFRGKRFFGDFEIHVEQADIKDLTVTASADKGCTVSMLVLSPSGSRVVRSFKPDFFLCRQSVRDAGKDYRNVLLGLNIGGVPSINSLNSLYNFQVRI